MAKHRWKNNQTRDQGFSQTCELCKMVRRRTYAGPRGGLSWSYYKDGGHIGTFTENQPKPPCEAAK